MRMCRVTVLFTLTLMGLSAAHAAAPFPPDDPDAGAPAAKEVYLFSQVNWTDVEAEEPYLIAPALEVDLGVLEDLQLHAPPFLMHSSQQAFRPCIV